jgi:hypothetical protein
MDNEMVVKKGNYSMKVRLAVEIILFLVAPMLLLTFCVPVDGYFAIFVLVCWIIAPIAGGVDMFLSCIKEESSKRTLIATGVLLFACAVLWHKGMFSWCIGPMIIVEAIVALLFDYWANKKVLIGIIAGAFLLMIGESFIWSLFG